MHKVSNLVGLQRQANVVAVVNTVNKKSQRIKYVKPFNITSHLQVISSSNISSSNSSRAVALAG